MTVMGIWQLKKIAMRSLARHKVKTILTSAAIMVSVAVYIFLNSWIGGMAIDSRRTIINHEMGAAKLQTKLYFERKDEMPSYESFMNWELYREALSREGYVSAPRFIFNGTLFSAKASAPILFHGVDPVYEAETMRYVPYIDFGRWVEDGNFEIAIGHLAAERLHVGIPTRPLRLELEKLIGELTDNQSDAEFIRSLYSVAPTATDIFSPDLVHIEGNERLVLGKNIPRPDLDRYWAIVAATNRNNVRINAVIDIKAVPETIRPSRWEGELLPALRSEDRTLVEAAYEYAGFMDAYLLTEDDPAKLSLILDAMIRSGFPGAVRHVNQVMDVVVVGVINSPAPLPNSNTAYIPLSVLQDEAGMMLDGAVTELVIRERGAPDYRLTGESESAATITAALKRGLASMGKTLPDELAVHTWEEYMAEYLGFEALETTAPQVIAFLLFILSFLGISNTILMAILERTRESAMMRALGMSDAQMIITYMLEAGFIGFIGSVLGIALGALINYPFVLHGMDFSTMANFSSDGSLGFRTIGVLRSTWDIPLMFRTGIVATLLASLVAFLPTRRATKKPITESLRFE